jgi:hypothetical protein
MTQDIDNVFVTQFESEVHMEFQRMGSAMRNTLRTKNNVKGSSTKFPVAGKGTAGAKSRHGQVPIMNASRVHVEVTLADRYAGEYIDKLDELKVEHDERQVAAQTVAGAMGRDVDAIVFTALDATTNANNVSVAALWTTPAGPISMMEAMGNASVPFDGNLYAVVCWEAWGDLLDLDEFDRADYVPGDRLWFEGVTAKKWLGFNWFPHEALPVDGSSDAKQFFYHKSAVGHAIGQDFSIDITWQGKEQMNLAVGSMSHGAGIIENAGVIEYVYNSTP